MKNRQLADQLTALRRDAGLSQEELAARLGVSRPAVSRWERGAALPGVENLTALAALYGVGAEELLAAPGPAAPAQPSPRRRQSAKGPVYGLLGLSLALLTAYLIWAAVYLIFQMPLSDAANHWSNLGPYYAWTFAIPPHLVAVFGGAWALCAGLWFAVWRRVRRNLPVGRPLVGAIAASLSLVGAGSVAYLLYQIYAGAAKEDSGMLIYLYGRFRAFLPVWVLGLSLLLAAALSWQAEQTAAAPPAPPAGKGAQLPQRLLALRRETALSQEEVARALGVSRQAVSKWERGSALPEPEKRAPLAALYGLRSGDLFPDSGRRAPLMGNRARLPLLPVSLAFSGSALLLLALVLLFQRPLLVALHGGAEYWNSFQYSGCLVPPFTLPYLLSTAAIQVCLCWLAGRRQGGLGQRSGTAVLSVALFAAVGWLNNTLPPWENRFLTRQISGNPAVNDDPQLYRAIANIALGRYYSLAEALALVGIGFLVAAALVGWCRSARPLPPAEREGGGARD